MDRVKKAFRLLFVITVAYTLGIWALSMAVPQIYIYLFSSGEAARQLSVLGRPMIRIFMGGFSVYRGTVRLPKYIHGTGQG